jgi:hypothetical protein
VQLLALSAAAFSALAAGDLAAADRLSPVSLSAYFAGPDGQHAVPGCWPGFLEVGEQIDDEDGLELVYERSADQPS